MYFFPVLLSMIFVTVARALAPVNSVDMKVVNRAGAPVRHFDLNNDP